METTGQVLTVIALARLLGPRDYGAFALALAIVTVLSNSLSVGGPTLLARFIPSVAPDQRLALARTLAARLGCWRAAQVALFGLVCTIAALADPGTFPPAICGLIALALAFDVGATLLFQIDLGLGRVSIFSFRFGVQNAILVGSSAALYSIGGSTGAVAGIAVSSGAVLAWGAVSVGGYLRGSRASGPVDVPSSTWRFGVYQAAGGALVALVHRGPVVAAAVIGASKVQTGFTGLAVGIGVAGTYAVSQAFAVNLPALAELARRDAPAAEAAAGAFARRALIVTVPLALLATALVGSGVPVVFGDSFRGAEPAIYVGLALLPLAPLTSLLSQVAALRLARRQLVVSRAIGAFVFLATAAVTIPNWHALGATAAVVAGTAATVAAGRQELAGGASWGLIGGGALGAAGVLAIGAVS